MDMEHDWKAERTEAALSGLVDEADMRRRCAALEQSLRYEASAHDRTRAQLLQACDAHADERKRLAEMVAAREGRIQVLAVEVGALRHQLAAAMRTIDTWTADRTPRPEAGLRRCDVSHRGVDLVADYAVVPGIDDSGEDCDAAETRAVYLGAVEVTSILSDEAEDAIADQIQIALDDWISDELAELAVAEVDA